MGQRTEQQLIDAVAAGEANEHVDIYWDRQDPNNEGPAYRMAIPESYSMLESGPLEFAGWAHGGDADTQGYALAEYFDGQGNYLGPDSHGVYPLFRI